MNLAIRDIRHSAFRFVFAALGVGLLVTASSIMLGLYRRIIADGLHVMQAVGADFWIVQASTRGPFAESSDVPATLADRALGVPGVARSRQFVLVSRQIEVPVAGAPADGGPGTTRQLRASMLGLDWPADTGAWLPLVGGRHIAAGHYEAVADASLGFALGDSVPLGRDWYHVVGLTEGLVDLNGDGVLVLRVADVLAVQQTRTSDEVLEARATQAGRAAGTGPARPGLNPLQPPPGGTSAGGPTVAAALVTLAPGADSGRVRAAIAGWGSAAVLSTAEEEDVLVNGRLARLRVQILLFTTILMVIAAVVIAILVYMQTVEKLHEIALLKLIGARNAVILGMIVQQALAMGVLALVGAVGLARLLIPHFPRPVLILPRDAATQAALLLLLALLASLAGIARALRVRAQEVLA
ncbi:ABC transporter permease [Gemmatimonadetes bacterium T265]|nr:ABC transporter permease [Gemmatimonadetes bacterium T265]